MSLAITCFYRFVCLLLSVCLVCLFVSIGVFLLVCLFVCVSIGLFASICVFVSIGLLGRPWSGRPPRLRRRQRAARRARPAYADEIGTPDPN